MAKRKKSLSELKKEAIRRKQEKALELLCRRCGLCCHVKVGLSDASYVVHPHVACKYLSADNKCLIYKERSIAIRLKICFTREDMINKDYILVEGCPYTELRPGYKPSQVLTSAEFDELIAKELALGNYNVLLANRAF